MAGNVLCEPTTERKALKMHFTINGESRTADVDIRTSLLDLLRENLGLTGFRNEISCRLGQYRFVRDEHRVCGAIEGLHWLLFSVQLTASACAPAIAIASSSAGVSPLTPMAPTQSPSTARGIPPCRATAPWSCNAPKRPSRTWASMSRLGRRKIAAVRALSTATSTLATCV